ncbi:MAG: TonB-dependent receptor [Prevotella sp.]|jgi:TonB-linked SusC/RagA family outer membrane protein|nr:TonB-dependent receptor [Prevotella sp.]MCH3992239.1 TonB-dependent receptor [Prevotella sp.]
MNFKILKFCISLLLMMCNISVFAQTRTIKGTVKDEQGTEIIGATVSVPGTKVAAVTDLDGNFSVDVPESATKLKINYIGYSDQIINISNRTSVSCVLKEDTRILNEVVSIGYAKVRRKDLTGAISSIEGKELENTPVATAAQALEGKIPGVNIISTSGAPGAGSTITVRGGMSLTQSSTPLYIVDGFEMDNALDNIDINDIESIDVLKDASSTAIYGARGSNGIILITTKSGKKGRTQVSYNTYFSFDRLSKKLNMMNNTEDYVKYQYEMAELQGKSSAWSNVFDNGKATDESDFYSGAFNRIADNYSNSYSVDWQNKAFGGSALKQNHNVNIQTGSEKTQVMLSYDYYDEDGLLANHSDKKNSFRAKVNSELWKGVRFDLNAMFCGRNIMGGGAYSGMKSVLLQPINGGSMFTEDELLNTQTYLDFSSLDSGYDTSNPLIQNLASTSKKRARIFSVNSGIEFDFLKHFTWRTAGSYTWTNSKSTSFSDENSTAYLTDPVNIGINGSIGNSEGYKWQITNTLNYNQIFAKKHKVNFLLGHEVTYSESEGNSISLNRFPIPNHGLDDISVANVSDKSSSHSHSGMVSFFGRANYTYDERYLLTASLRADGSSKFMKGHQWGYFPSAALAWRITEEKFFRNSSLANVINNLKLRVGYGATGNNNISDYLYRTNVSLSTYPINNNITNPAYVLSSILGNSKLKWETLASTNIGLDLSLFNSRINLTTEWYNNQANNLLMECVIPTSTGYTYQYQNVGKIRNRGLEFTLNTVNIQAKNWRWTSDLNLSFNRSKVISLENGETTKTFSVGGNRSGCVTYYATVGRSLGDMYGYKYEGVYTTDDFNEVNGKFVLKDGVVAPSTGTVQPGDIKFAADNEDGTKFTRKLVKIGNGTPDCTGGLNNSVTYKNFDFSMFMKFSIGNDIYNATKHSMSPYAMFQNVPSKFGNNYYRLVDPATGVEAMTLARLKELNPDESSRTWSLSKVNSSYITYPSSYYVEDGSYLRIEQITLGYSFPKTWLKRACISNARIYVSVYNLATITGYDGYDPEVSAANNVVTTPGYDSSTYPRSRSFVIGLNLTF